MLLVRRTRLVEAARIEAERRAELGEMATGLAHEIRNPLNAMSLNLELLEEQLEKGSSGLSTAELAAATLHAQRTRAAPVRPPAPPASVWYWADSEAPYCASVLPSALLNDIWPQPMAWFIEVVCETKASPLAA